MVSVTLDDRDREILERLRRADADVETLATDVACSRDALTTRLPALADNGLVERVETDEGSDRYAITESGRRTLEETGPGSTDELVDTPAVVEDRIQSYDLRADREAAVRSAFAFLRYWGEAIASEIVDAVYSEQPAGYESPHSWWDDLVRDRLAALPLVEPGDSPTDPWRFTGRPAIEGDGADGRLVPEASPAGPADADTGTESTAAESSDRPAPSVKYAIEHTDGSDAERAAVRAAFAELAQSGEVSAEDLGTDVYPDHEAGYDDPDAWWDDLVHPGFARLPGVEAVDESDTRWTYRQRASGPMSTPGSAEPDSSARESSEAGGRDVSSSVDDANRREQNEQ